MAVPHPRELLVPALAVLGLTSFAIAQPVLDILGANAEFFVAHRADAAQVVLFALALYVVPAAVVGVVVGALGLLSRRVGKVALAGVGGVLTAGALVHVVPDQVRDRTWWYVAGVALVVAASAWAFLRTRAMVRFWQVMGLLSPLVIVVFLFFSPASDVVFADDVAAVGQGATSDADLVFVVLDELSAAAVVDGDGDIDPVKAPNMARLAGAGTFYADTTTVSSETTRAVPSILSGRIPGETQLPLASQFPQNLFTLLAPSHELVVDEIVTQLCPDGLCTRVDPEPDSVELYDDARVVFLHTLLPRRWARAWLPDITTQWAGFGADEIVPSLVVDEPSYIAVREEVADDQQDRAEAFIERLGTPGVEPRLDYVHLALPHVPYRYLADGRSYNGEGIDGLQDKVWSEDPTETAVADLRYQIQVANVDRLIGEMIDALVEAGRWEQSMVVVVADHGVAHRPGLPRRIPTQHTLGDLAWVPLLIKFPGSVPGGERVDEPVQTIDILPTIADELGVVLGQPVDGSSLRAERPGVRRTLLGYPEWDLDVVGGFDDAISRSHRTVPAGTPARDYFGFGELQGETGAAVTALGQIDDPVDAGMRPDRVDLWADADPERLVPALLRANVTGLAPGDHVAVFLAGRLAGSALVGDEDRLLTMLDPAVVEPGYNPMTAYLVDGDHFHSIAIDDPLAFSIEAEEGAITAITRGGRRWDRAAAVSGALDVAPGKRPDAAGLVAGWVARCDAERPEAEILLVVIEDRPVPTSFGRPVRDDIDCLEEPAPVGFAARIRPELVKPGARVVALFDDGTFAVLE